MSDRTILINRYEIQETIGKGGMAIVYRANDLTLERSVAIKVLRQDFSKDEAFREHFRQEAKAAANLSHPNIVTVYDFGLDSESLFIIMEYVPGTDLKQYLAGRGRLSVGQAMKLILQACAGVGYAHRANLVHCDIKPQNLLITPDHRVKVADFGIARALASIDPGEKTKIVWGSPHYFSPEQAAGLPPSQASDVYSLGIIMYEMLTGQLPFTAPTAAELSKMHREVLPKAPHELNPSISLELEQVLLKVLSKEPASRYRTADQLGRVLMTWQQNSLSVGRDIPQITSVPPPAARETQPYQPPSSSPVAQTTSEPKNPLNIDWVTVLLALFALIALGGLVPLFLWVYFVYFPPIR